MRIYWVKYLLSNLILSVGGILTVSAQAVKPDTTTLVAALSKKELDYKMSSIIPANIVFPACLAEFKDQSLDYIKKFSAQKREFLLRTYETGKKYFPKIISILNRYQLPEELKVLIALESGFSGNAVSSAGAVGYWQMMANVAKAYGLQVVASNSNTSVKSVKKDERKNFNKSTLAAVKYLNDQKLNVNNDILLMVACYNCGPGTVSRAMKKCNKETPSFWDVKNFLPKETRNYVLNFIALNVILNNFENFEKRQLLFDPKIIDIPFQTLQYNNSASAQPSDID